MKFTCDCDVLKIHLKFATGFVGAGSLNQLYRLLYLRAEDSRVELRSMNGVIYTQIYLDAEVTKPGTVLLDPVLLTPIIATLDESKPVRFGEIKGKPNTVRVSQGRRQRRLQSADPEEFPGIPLVEETTKLHIPLSQILGYMGLVSFARSQIRERPVLQGLYLEDKLGLLVAGDGMRVASVGMQQKVSIDCVITPEICDVLRDMTAVVSSDDIEMIYGRAGWLRVQGEGVTCWAAMLGYKYPSAAAQMALKLAALPGGTTVKFDRDAVLPTIQLATTYSAMASQKQESQAVIVEIGKDTVSFKMETWAGGLNDEINDVEIEGDPVTIKLHPAQLVQAIAVAPSDEIEITVWAAHQPILVKAPGADWSVIQTPMADREVAKQWQAAQAQQAEDEDDF